MASKTKRHLEELFEKQKLVLADGTEVLVCPLCLGVFSRNDIELGDDDQRVLSIEHAPQQSAGTAKTECCITCRECNNGCGFESRAAKQRQQAEVPAFFLPVARVTTTTSEFGLVLPEIEFAHTHGKLGKTGLIEPVPPSQGSDLVSGDDLLFELKTAYLVAFATYGYSFILSDDLHVVREAILGEVPLHACAVFEMPTGDFGGQLEPLTTRVVELDSQRCVAVHLPATHWTKSVDLPHVVFLPYPGSGPDFYGNGALSEFMSGQRVHAMPTEIPDYPFPESRKVPRHWDRCAGFDHAHPTISDRLAVAEAECQTHGSHRYLVRLDDSDPQGSQGDSAN